MSGLITTAEQYKDAEANGYALGAFNTVNLEVTRAIHVAAQEEKSPFILQATKGAINYASVTNLAAMAKNLNAEYGTQNSLHLDHGPDLETVLLCRDNGFTSVMYDGSKHELDENIRLTREVRDALGPEWSLEGELGKISGVEDDINVSERDAFFTDPDEAERFVKETGITCLAVSIGNQHGQYKGDPELDFERLEEITKRTSVPIVLHGASGLSEDDLKRAVGLGVRKVNFDTDLRIAFRKGIEEFFSGNESQYDIRKYMKVAMREVTEVVRSKMRILESAGKMK